MSSPAVPQARPPVGTWMRPFRGTALRKKTSLAAQRTGGQVTGHLTTRRGAGDPETRAEWTTVLRCGRLRSAPLVVDAGLRTEWEPLTLHAALCCSTRPAWATPRWPSLRFGVRCSESEVDEVLEFLTVIVLSDKLRRWTRRRFITTSSRLRAVQATAPQRNFLKGGLLHCLRSTKKILCLVFFLVLTMKRGLLPPISQGESLEKQTCQ